MYVTEGLGLDLDFSSTIPELADMGQLLKARGDSGTGDGVVADLAELRGRQQPDR